MREHEICKVMGRGSAEGAGVGISPPKLNILPGESDTRLENSHLFTCHVSNHLCSYLRSKPMSNNPGLDLDHYDPLIGSCSLVALHVPQHILQSVGSIYNLEGCHIAGYTLKMCSSISTYGHCFLCRFSSHCHK